MGQVLQTSEAKHTRFRMPLDGAEEATATIGAAISSIHLSALPDGSSQLMEGELDYVGELIAEDEGDTRRQIVLRDEARNVNYRGPELRYVIRLHPGVRWTLNVGTATGDIHLELQTLAVSALDMGTASGAVWAALPASPTDYPVTASVASGDVHLRIAARALLSALTIRTASGGIHVDAGDGAALGALTLHTASGDMRLDLQQAASADVRINAVSGDVHVQLPEHSPARVTIQHLLSGDVKLRGDLNRISGSKRTGVWQTANWQTDAPAFTVNVASIVSGDVRVK